MTEVRVTNDKTGGQKGSKPARFDLIPAGPLWHVAELYGRGADKYAPRNWQRGYDWSLSFAALQRHAWLFWNGEDYDEETRCHHLASVVFHAFAMLEFAESHPELDDRPNDGVERVVVSRQLLDHLEREAGLAPGPIITSDHPLTGDEVERLRKVFADAALWPRATWTVSDDDRRQS